MPNTGVGGDDTRSNFIPSIYSYCDSWCSRCRFTRRCRSFQIRAAFEQSAVTGRDSITMVGDALAEGEERGGAIVSDAQHREFLAFVERANRPMTPDERAEWDRRIGQWDAHLDSDQMFVDSREYSAIALQILEAVEAMTAAREDPVLVTALESIGWFAYLIPAKARRALGGRLHAADDDDVDSAALDDANGSAKVMRLAIAESRDAWHAVLQVAPAGGDGVAAAMIRRLWALDAAVASAFPDAERFHRPGFDDEPV